MPKPRKRPRAVPPHARIERQRERATITPHARDSECQPTPPITHTKQKPVTTR